MRIDGLLRGRDLTGEGWLAGRGDALELATPAGVAMLPLAALEGVHVERGGLDLHLSTGDVLRLSGPEQLGQLSQALARRSCIFPEVTLSLRGLGSRERDFDDAHDAFFAPLLGARRQVERSSGPEALCTALDAAALRERMTAALRSLAASRYGSDPAGRRALEARLLEGAGALLASLERLQRAERAFLESEDIVRFVRWREWSAIVRDVFQRADACWLDLRPLLADAPPPRSRWRRWLRLGAAGASLLLPTAVRAQHVTIRVPRIPAESLRAHGFDVVGTGPGIAYVVADSADRARLSALGFGGTPVFAPGASVRRQAMLPDTSATRIYRPYDDPQRGVAFFLDSIARANPRVRLDTIGRTLGNRPILVVKIGERDDSPARPNVIFMATYHAREWVATEMALRLIRYLAQPPPLDTRLDSLLRRRDVWVLPVANPDGYQYTFSADRLWRKNRRPNPDGSVGVDLNRNHAAGWGLDNEGSSPSPASEVYRGPAPESELETQAIVSFHRDHPPVLSVSYHSYTGLVLYPPGNTYGKLAQDLGVFRALAGTDIHPAVIDHLPGSNRDHYHPAPSWNLYTTNGDYTDWAHGTLGAIAFTPELTSGFEGATYYGFEFPEDETKLQTVFTDNLPFALDVLDAAADPLRARPRSSGMPSEPVAVESGYPIVRARILSDELSSAAVRIGSAPLQFGVDTVGPGRYTKRLLAPVTSRPAEITVAAATRTSRFTLLSGDGAESRDAAWTPAGDFARGVPAFAGAAAWLGGNGGSLRSPPIAVPGDADTVSVLFWTRYLGDGFDLRPHGELRVSTDDGASWTQLGFVAGSAPAYYPERADLVGYAGRSIRLSFEASFGISQAWWLDEIQVFAHRRMPVDVVPVAEGPLASENPVRGGTVHFAWPFGPSSGQITVYDFAGRRVWASGVAGAISLPIVWDVAARGARNGVYLVVARSEGRTRTLKLFVARRG